MIEKLYRICESLEACWPENANPFRILARLMEESGELAEQIHLRENLGLKGEKLGDPDDEKLAKKFMDVMTAVLDVARYYKVEEALEARVQMSYQIHMENKPGRGTNEEAPL